MFAFNSSQKSVIELKDGEHVCLAPAGSGKTEVLTERISNALSQGQAVDKMLCLTFTNRAGLHMRTKVEQRLCHKAANIFIGNIHAFCFQLIQQFGLRKSADIVSESLQKKLILQSEQQLESLLQQPLQIVIETLKKTLAHYNLKNGYLDKLSMYNLRCAYDNIFECQNIYDAWSMESVRRLILPLISPAASMLNDQQKTIIRERLKCLSANIPASELSFIFAYGCYINQHYQALKHAHHLYDYDDLILDTLVEYENPAKHQHYNWIQIDEIQDLAPIHWLLIDAIKTLDAHIVLFGDVNQSIYRFLGASIELTEAKLYKNIHYLQQNYRNPANLVELSNQYVNLHFPKAYRMEAQAVQPQSKDALQWLSSQNNYEHLNDVIRYISKQNKQQSIAVLLSSNKQAHEFSKLLSFANISHFYVGTPDLLSQPFFLDFMAFLQAILQPYDRLAWSRLLWKFGNIDQTQPTHLSEIDPELAALKVCLALEEQGCWLSNFYGIKDIFSHQQQGLVQAFKQNQLIYFDTESTGLDVYNDDIVQIAAINRTKELDLYCHTDLNLTESSAIHHITAEILAEKAKDQPTQLAKFIKFAAEHAFVAHNLKYDHAIMNQSLIRHLPHALSDYHQANKFCTLELSKQLYPHLKSYKLVDLLIEFKLEGNNSHNALDDVKAGYALLSHLIKKIEAQQADLDHVIQSASACLTQFNQKISPLWNQAQQLLMSDQPCTVPMLFDLFFEYTYEHLNHVYEQYSQDELLNLRSKLFSHANLHFNPNDQLNYFKKAWKFYQTAKESDLITASDRVIVSTIHRSKGLEFDQVILPALTNREWPNYPIRKQAESLDEYHRKEAKQLAEEQKRLLYVALTRAKQKLVIGSFEKYANQKTTYTLCSFLSPFQHYFMPLKA